MPIIHRAILIWILLALFLVLTVLKLDNRSEWDWFTVFTPLWFFNIVFVSFVAYRVYQHSRRDHTFRLTNHEVVSLICIFCKFMFEVLLCLRLQHFPRLSFFIIMIPLWCLLLTLITYFTFHHLRVNR